MVAHRRALAAAQRRQAELVVTIAGNGGDLGPSDLQEAAETIQQSADAIAECVRELDDAGVQVKSVEEGLLDFPSERERRGRAALLERRRGAGRVLARGRRGIRRTEAAR